MVSPSYFTSWVSDASLSYPLRGSEIPLCWVFLLIYKSLYRTKHRGATDAETRDFRHYSGTTAGSRFRSGTERPTLTIGTFQAIYLALAEAGQELPQNSGDLAERMQSEGTSRDSQEVCEASLSASEAAAARYRS